MVYFREGIYTLESTVEFGPEDSGSSDHPVIYRAYPGETPVISGGRELDGWRRTNEGFWEAYVGDLDFRQLYVNGKKAPRSRYPNDGYLRLKNWDEENQTIVLERGTLDNWRDFRSAEIYIQMAWSIAVMRLSDFAWSATGDVLTVTNPERDLISLRRNPTRRPDQPFHLENAKAFINTPGEWSLDRESGICTYLPREGETLNRTHFIVPHTETLLEIKGELSNPVRNLEFQGLTFMYSNWTRPSEKGYLNLQAGQYSIAVRNNSQYVARPPAAVYAAGVENLVLRRNVFKNLGAVGLDIHYGSRKSLVVGNVFYDIAGSAISIARLSDPDVSIGRPYNPEDLRDRCLNDHIHNNYIESVGFEYGGAIGILAGYATGITIEHNDLLNLAYSGISLGWGWTGEPNAMKNNRIARNRIESPMTLFSDGGGIYTLSKMPGSIIEENYVTNVQRSEWGDPHTTTKAYYLDEFTDGLTFSSNWWSGIGQDVQRFFFHRTGNIQITAFDPRRELRRIVANAGLQDEYRDIVELARD